LQRWLVEAGQERYRAEQILDWVYSKLVDRFELMSNLPKALRAWLAEQADLYRSQIVRESVSADGTVKLLLGWPDGTSTEAVWIPEGDRHTACVSCQVGCPVGCRFCASGLDGLERNLTAGEIVEQALWIGRLIHRRMAEAGQNHQAGLTNIVFMGIGEPLANYDAVISAIRVLNAPWGMGLGARRITLSTVGLPEQIRRLAEEGLQLNLAWSLHAADQQLRQALVPWARSPLIEVVDACRYYFERTGREITLEYVLLEGVNMEPRHAAQLAGLARKLRCNVNLIRYNPVPGLPFRRPTARAAYGFQRILRARGLNAHLRTSRGRDICAACGQLRRDPAIRDSDA